MITIKRGDTARKLTDTLKINGQAIDLTGATVILVWSDKESVKRKDADILDAPNGKVSYSFTTADVTDVDEIKLEWEITFVDSTVLTVPTINYILLKIVNDLG